MMSRRNLFSTDRPLQDFSDMPAVTFAPLGLKAPLPALRATSSGRRVVVAKAGPAPSARVSAAVSARALSATAGAELLSCLFLALA